MSLLAPGWPRGFSAQQVRAARECGCHQRRHRKGDLLTLTCSAAHTPLPLACSFLKALCQESGFALSPKMPKVSCVLWRWLRDWSPVPTLFLPLGVDWALSGADATRLQTQCCGCLPGCWSQAGFGCWEGMVWARSSLMGATTLLPPLTCLGDHRHQWPNWGKPKHLDLFILG